ncbi:MAG: glycosyl hydrolase family 28-related protein, partial [Psychromonas sp.]
MPYTRFKVPTSFTMGTLALGIALATVPAFTANAAPPQQIDPMNPDFGPNVMIFDPSMDISSIQATVDSIHTMQVNDEMGERRYSLLFLPGTYGTSTDVPVGDQEPLHVQVGYYTQVAGLGASPDDVQINGAIEVYNQCFNDLSNPEFIGCFALNNFWRSLSNLTINVNTYGQGGCEASANFWAVSQAVSMRRVDVKGGNLTLMDYCTQPSFASGGFIADTRVADMSVANQDLVNGSQQQWYTRNSVVNNWTNPVWNQVFSG